MTARPQRQDSPYLAALRERVLVFDGAMGTSIQRYNLSPADFGGERLEGCNDYLVISKPDVIEEIHASFLEVGCDVVETDTFRSNRITLGEYGLGEQVDEINRAAAQLARRAADRFATPERPRFVAGSIGPSGFLPSSSDPTLGKVTFDELVPVFAEQARALIAGGVDLPADRDLARHPGSEGGNLWLPGSDSGGRSPRGAAGADHIGHLGADAAGDGTSPRRWSPSSRSESTCSG